jgi:hypothetical protein
MNDSDALERGESSSAVAEVQYEEVDYRDASRERGEEHESHAQVDSDSNGPLCTAKGFISGLCILFCHPCAPRYFLDGEPPAELEEYYAVCANWGTYTDVERAAWVSLGQARLLGHKPTVSQWRHLYPRLSTGDLVFFRCSDVCGSSLVTLATGRWSHVGMVVVLYSPPDKTTRRRSKVILLWESVSHEDGLPDFTTGDFASGVRLVDLKQRLLHSASHEYGVAKLSHATSERCKEITQEFISFHGDAVRRKYDGDKLHLCRVALDCGALGHNSHVRRPHKYFCSQLVCHTMQEIGLIPEMVNGARTTPTDFWSYDLVLRGGSAVEALYFMPRLDHPVCAASYSTRACVPAHHTTNHTPVPPHSTALVSQKQQERQQRDRQASDGGSAHPQLRGPGLKLGRTAAIVEAAARYGINDQS